MHHYDNDNTSVDDNVMNLVSLKQPVYKLATQCNTLCWELVDQRYLAKMAGAGGKTGRQGFYRPRVLKPGVGTPSGVPKLFYGVPRSLARCPMLFFFLSLSHK